MSISATSSSQIQTDYMKLLVTQLQNQNPLEPMDNSDMSAQLAQFSQLAQLESMKTNFADVLKVTNQNYANSLLGRNVTFYAENDITGELEQKVGRVDSVFNDIKSGENLLGIKMTNGEEIAEYTLSLDAIVLIQN